MGSALSKKFNPNTDIGYLTGKVILVTGGNSGIGYATVQHLARRGAKVYMAGRNQEKGRAAIEKLKKEGLGPGNGEVLWLDLELGDPRKAKRAAEEFRKIEENLDVLVNNAALILVPHAISQDGIQDVMMVNYIGHFVFTMTLLPLLKKTAKGAGADVRIVNVSSDAVQMYGNGLRYRNREDFNDDHAKAWMPALARYGTPGVLALNELQRRLDEEGVPIIVLSIHPGAVNTEGNMNYAAQRGGITGALYGWMSKLFFINPTSGAYNSVFAASAPVVKANPEKYKGVYLRPTGVISAPGKDGANADLAKELWGTTEGILKEIGVEI